MLGSGSGGIRAKVVVSAGGTQSPCVHYSTATWLQALTSKWERIQIPYPAALTYKEVFISPSCLLLLWIHRHRRRPKARHTTCLLFCQEALPTVSAGLHEGPWSGGRILITCFFFFFRYLPSCCATQDHKVFQDSPVHKNQGPIPILKDLGLMLW